MTEALAIVAAVVVVWEMRRTRESLDSIRASVGQLEHIVSAAVGGRQEIEERLTKLEEFRREVEAHVRVLPVR